MSDTVRQLIVGGVTVPVYAMTNISQRYEAIEAKSKRRFLGGGGWQRVTYSGKLRTSITGSGLIPASLGSVNYDGSVTISCIKHRGILSASTTIALPSARRTDTDSEPYGRALVGDKWISTPVSMSVDNAILTPVSGATIYQAVYFPEIVCHVDTPSEDKPAHGPIFGWSLTADEI